MSKPTWRRAMPSALLCLGLLTLAGSFESASEREGLAQGYLVTTAAQGRNAALAQAGGEFRIVAANLLWNKVVDHYHHQYLATGGDWSKNESLLPLLQTIILLDPHFVQAYEIMGGAILPRTGRVAEGEKVIAQGLRHNPNEWELYREMAMLLSYTEHKPEQALPYAEKGRQLANDEFSRNLMARLCKTLHRDINDAKVPDAKTVNALSPPPTPARASNSFPVRPSV